MNGTHVHALVADLRRLAPQAQGMSADSRRLAKGDVFLAFPGRAHDGRQHIGEAIAAGASAIVWETQGYNWPDTLMLANLPTTGLSEQAPYLASEWYGRPSERLWMTGITGTNGKTSIANWLAQCFTQLGRRTATIGTIGNGFPGATTTSTHTTPDAVSLQGMLATFHAQGADGVAMEVSSHGLDQGRVDGVAFDVAVLSNLSRDHLDYHGNMAAYAAAKATLFHGMGLKAAVLNADDAFGAELLSQLHGPRLISYGLQAGDLRAHCQADRLGLRLEIASPWGEGVLKSQLLGEFNAYNLLATLGALIAADIAFAEAVPVLEARRAVAGRMQRVDGDEAAPTVIVDFAHTPDALEKVLTTLKPLTSGRLICVFGCGGDRDTGKRPLMGAAVAAGADRAFVTSDNPRHEDPAAIVAHILSGMPPGQTVILDRREAISRAIAQADSEDIVVLAGKGHEDYQDVAGVKRPFSDFEEARAALAIWRAA